MSSGKLLLSISIVVCFGVAMLSSCVLQEADRTSSDGNREQEEYIIDPDTSGLYSGKNAYTKDLFTIKKWEGSGDTILTFHSDKSPMVINYGYTSTSQIATSFSVGFRDKIMEQTFVPGVYRTLFNGNIIESTGKIELRVRASGCSWWIKIGVE